MSGEREPAALLAGLSPEIRLSADGTPARFVFATTEHLPATLQPIATVRECEGITAVVEQSAADGQGLDHDFVAAMITLRVRSALDAVGLTAVVASRLAEVGISCKVVAGYHHDHLSVPIDRAEEAVGQLRGLG